MNRTRSPIWIWVAILLPALISSYGIVQRHRVEAKNRAVAITTEFDTVEALATGSGMTVNKALPLLRASGLNGLVLSEGTVSDLLVRGEATLTTEFVPDASGTPGAAVSHLAFTDPRQIERVRRGLRIRFGDVAATLAVRDNRLLLPPVSAGLIRNTSIGLDPDEVAQARLAGLFVIARHQNTPGLSASAVRETLAWSKELGSRVYLPSGDQVLGRRRSMPAAAEVLRELGLLYASVEFGKIGGDATMLQMVPERVVRLHSAQAAELDRLPDMDAVDRYAKAARERNMRILLVRPISNSGDSPLQAFSEFVGKISTKVTSEGNVIGLPHGYDEPSLPHPYFLLLGLSVVPAALAVATAVTNRPRVLQIIGALLSLLGLACWVHVGQEFMALTASVVFPLLGFVLLESQRPKSPALGFALVTAVSVVGGLVVAGLLNGRLYFIGADLPLGVKIGLFVPILLVGIYFTFKLLDFRATLRNPITWGTAALSFAVVATLALLVARSGNDTGAGASSFELVFRNYLDRFLYVRPRTKEFLIGHPALVVGIGMLATLTRDPSLRPKLGGWTALVLMLGSVGMTGAVNTLWHLHIPVTLSLARIGIGAVLGCMIGLGMWEIVRRLLPKGEEGPN